MIRDEYSMDQDSNKLEDLHSPQPEDLEPVTSGYELSQFNSYFSPSVVSRSPSVQLLDLEDTLSGESSDSLLDSMVTCVV